MLDYEHVELVTDHDSWNENYDRDDGGGDQDDSLEQKSSSGGSMRVISTFFTILEKSTVFEDG